MRDRLIELIKQAEKNFSNTGKPVLDIEEYVADHLLANGVIVPPFKVGDAVYFLATIGTIKERDVYDIFIGIVQAIVYNEKGFCVPVTYTNGWYISHTSEDFNKIFLTKEDAKKALAERSKT